MAKSFEALRQELRLQSVCKKNSQLSSLKSWCLENISKEIRYTVGSLQEKYSQYMMLAEDYLDYFLPLVEKNQISKNNAEFNKLVEYAIEKGYTVFISSQSSIEQSILENVDGDGTVLHKSAAGGHFSIFCNLLSRGADVRIKDYEGHSPLKDALSLPHFFNKPLKERKNGIFRQLLLKAPELITERDNAGNNLIHHMAQAGFDDLMSEVLQKKPHLAFTANHRGEYPIHTAILNKQTKALSRLLQLKGASALEDARKRTALHYAACYGTALMVKLCCDAIPTDCYLTVLPTKPLDAYFANKNYNQYIVTDTTLWFFDAFTRKLAQPFFLDKESFVTLKSKLNSTKNHMATQEELKLIRSLTGHFKPNYFNARDIDDSTPILLAASFNNLDAMKFLLTNKACIRKRDFQGFSILHHAISIGSEPMLRLIMDNLPRHILGALLKKGDDNGYSLLYYAKKIGNEDIEDLLLNHGVTEMTYSAYHF